MMLLVKNFFKKLLGQSGMAFIAKYYQILASLFTAAFLYILKERHDSKIKKETTEEIEGQATNEAAVKQGVLDGASISALVSNVDNPFPSSSELELLRKTTRPSAMQKTASKRIFKKLRPKS